MKNIKVLLYTLTGLMAGIAVGVLLAPSAGNETRTRLMRSLSKFRSSLLQGEEEFTESELEMDATNGRSYGF